MPEGNQPQRNGENESPTNSINTTMIYNGTGQIIKGEAGPHKVWYKDANKNYPVGGGHRPSTRYGIYHTKKSNPPCVPYKNYECTFYVNIGPRADNADEKTTKITVGGLGPDREMDMDQVEETVVFIMLDGTSMVNFMQKRKVSMIHLIKSMK